MKSLSSFLMSRDVLGHPLSVNYKGSDTFPTKLGAFISMAVHFLVLAQLGLKLLELVNMSDPSILAYDRPIYDDELDDIGSIYLEEYSMHVGLYISKFGEDGGSEIPESVGKFMSYQKSFEPDPDHGDFYDLIPCTEEF